MRVSNEAFEDQAPEYRAMVLLEELKRRSTENRIHNYRPNQKQLDFHASGRKYSERMLSAGNQLGKTFSGAHEAAFHATGLYPDWWKGAVFKKHTRGRIASETAKITRDVAQRLLLGATETEWGTGIIPKKCIVKIVRSRVLQGAVDRIFLKHVSGGISWIQFMSYDQGWQRFQAETLDWNWNDEEPPIKIYTENLTRSNNGELGPFSFTTFTPLSGMTETVLRFFSSDNTIRAKNGHLTMMGLNDVDHYSPERKQQILASYLPHEREARANGTPILGSGRIFTVAYEALEVEPFDIPAHWPVIAGIDLGGASASAHPAAAAKLAYDRDNDIVYVVRTWRGREVTLANQASVVRQYGQRIPVAWPNDALQADRKSGEQYKVEFEREGLNMCPHYARYPDYLDNGTMKIGVNAVEAGVLDMVQRTQQGRIKVFRGQDSLKEEYDMYHRKDGAIEKINDDILCAIRYGMMMLRYAEPEQQTGWTPLASRNINDSLDVNWVM